MRTRLVGLGLVWAVVALGAPVASAQPVIDGTADGAYGAALSTQNTDTHFGNSTSGDISTSLGGSEIDQVFATVANGRLYVMITGNLESNFNKMEVFIDSVAGGVNTLDGAGLARGVDGFCCGGFAPPDGSNTTNFGALQRMSGLTFDAGFDADFFLTFSNGFENQPAFAQPGAPPEFWALSAHYAELTSTVLIGDANKDNQVTGADLISVQQNFGNVGDLPLQGDANNDGQVTGADLISVQQNFGDVLTAPATAAAGMQLIGGGTPNVQRDPGGVLGDDPSVPKDPLFGDGTQVGPALPGLSQGELVDRAYAFANGGCTDDTTAATGCIAPELEFTLAVDPAESGQADPADNNPSSHRNFNNTIGLEMAIDNSNIAGVNGSGGPDFSNTGDPENVLTGLEFSIALSEIGDPAGDIRITAFINGSGHDFASNQFSGVGTLQGNEGGDGNGGFVGDLSGIDLATIAGDQFVTVTQGGAAPAVPEPATLALLAMGVLAVIGRKNRG